LQHTFSEQHQPQSDFLNDIKQLLIHPPVTSQNSSNFEDVSSAKTLSHDSKFVFPDGRVVDFNEVKPPARKSTPKTARNEKSPESPVAVIGPSTFTVKQDEGDEIDDFPVPVSSRKGLQSVAKETMPVPSFLKVIDKGNQLGVFDSEDKYDFPSQPIIRPNSGDVKLLSSSSSRPCTTSSERTLLLLSRPVSSSLVDAHFSVEKELKRNQRKWNLLSKLNSLQTNERTLKEIIDSDRIMPESFGFFENSQKGRNSPNQTRRVLEESVRFHPVSPTKKKLLLPSPLSSPKALKKMTHHLSTSASNLGSHASLLFDRPVSSSSAKSQTSQKRHYFAENSGAVVTSHFRNLLSRGSERDDNDLYSDFGL
jgi:hypothetical protein